MNSRVSGFGFRGSYRLHRLPELHQHLRFPFSGSASRILGIGPRVSGPASRVWGFVSRGILCSSISDSQIRVKHLDVRVWVSAFGVPGLGFEAWGVDPLNPLGGRNTSNPKPRASGGPLHLFISFASSVHPCPGTHLQHTTQIQ